MSEEVSARVFDNLFTTKSVEKGTGLGLKISHQIVVKDHRGTLEAHSKPGKGTAFKICLPITAA